MPHTEVDLLLDANSDLTVGGNGDLSLSDEKTSLSQMVLFRLKTDHFDYEPFPFIGANLSSIIGEPNTDRTGDLAKELVFTSLTQDGVILAGSLFVEEIPIGLDVMQLFVIITDRTGTTTEPVTVTSVLNLSAPSTDEESILNTAG
jgi:hypothetical protein